MKIQTEKVINYKIIAWRKDNFLCDIHVEGEEIGKWQEFTFASANRDMVRRMDEEVYLGNNCICIRLYEETDTEEIIYSGMTFEVYQTNIENR